MGETEKVIQDCSSALELDPTYVKALSRRAQAREQIGGKENLFSALCGGSSTDQPLPFLIILRSDFTAAAIIDEFKTESTANSVDRVMKSLATEKAKEVIAVSLLSI
jgi:mitochondrial import receptor subunit TOM70